MRENVLIWALFKKSYSLYFKKGPFHQGKANFGQKTYFFVNFKENESSVLFNVFQVTLNLKPKMHFKVEKLQIWIQVKLIKLLISF